MSRYQKKSSGDPWRDLADAVILQACSDLRSQLRKKKKGHEDPLELAELEDFFRSHWFSELTKLDGNEILQEIEEEYDE